MVVGLAVAVAVPVAVEGGFTSTSQTLLVGLALVALAPAVEGDERPAAGLARSPALLALAALALLAAVSAAWTVGDMSEALRSGLVTAALAAVAIVAAWITRVHGIAWVAGLIAVVALAEAVTGLASVALRDEPWAQRIGGSWRPGGTLEYPPALAVLQVSALPILGVAMLRGSRPVALGAAAAAALAGCVVGTADSRLAIAMVVILAAAALACARMPLGLAPGRVALAAAIPAAAALASHLLLGGFATPGEAGGEGGRVALLLAIAGAAPLAWAAVLRLTPPRRRVADSRARRVAPAAGIVAALALVLSVAALAGPREGAGVEPVSGFDHGRGEEWGVAIDAALERPLTGAGAGAYALAAAEQGGGETIYAHNLVLEAWVELGPLGLAAVAALLAAVAALAWRGRRDPRAWLVAPAAVAFPLANLLDWTWHLAGAGALWAVALGALIALDAERHPAPDGPSCLDPTVWGESRRAHGG